MAQAVVNELVLALPPPLVALDIHMAPRPSSPPTLTFLPGEHPSAQPIMFRNKMHSPKNKYKTCVVNAMVNGLLHRIEGETHASIMSALHAMELAFLSNPAPPTPDLIL